MTIKKNYLFKNTLFWRHVFSRILTARDKRTDNRFSLCCVFGKTYKPAQGSATQVSVTNLRACEPEQRAASREPIFASHCFFSYWLIDWFIYLFIFWRFKFNVNVFFSKWCTWQKKHKFSIFFRAWNSAQVVSVVCWRSVYSFRYEWNFDLPLQILYQNVDYVKLTNIQIYTGKRSSEANFR